MSVWKKVKIKDIAILDNGINFNKSAYASGIKIIGVSDFKDRFSPDFSTLQEVKEEIVRSEDYLQPGDILFVRSNGNRDLVGRCMLIDKNILSTFSGFCIRLRINDKNTYNPYFFTYHFKAPLFRKSIAGSAIGANIQNLSQNRLGNYELNIPEYFIQCRIAEILFRYDSLIENYQKQIKLLEEAAQRLYKEWFVDLRFPGYENTKIVDGVPEGWKKVFLTELIEPQYGKDHKSLSDGLIPLYGSGGIMRYVNKVLYSGESVLIPRKGSLNNIMLVSGSFWTIDTMFYSKPLLNYIMKLVYFYLKGKDLYMYNVGAAVPSMTVNILSKMDIILPDENIRKCFDDKLSLIFNNITNIVSQIRILTEARDRLLPKLMSGEIEV